MVKRVLIKIRWQEKQLNINAKDAEHVAFVIIFLLIMRLLGMQEGIIGKELTKYVVIYVMILKLKHLHVEYTLILLDQNLARFLNVDQKKIL